MKHKTWDRKLSYRLIDACNNNNSVLLKEFVLTLPHTHTTLIYTHALFPAFISFSPLFLHNYEHRLTYYTLSGIARHTHS